MNIVLTQRFGRSFRKFVKGNAALQKSIEDTILKLATDPFSPKLASHKLGGKLLGLRACSCGYDCRIVFTIERNKETSEEEILLLDIGTHDEVY